MTEQLLLLPNGLKAHLYYWGRLDHVTMLNICAPGMPNYPEKGFFENLPENLRGQAFLVLYYYGYWFSSGVLSVQSTADSIVDAIVALQNGDCKNSFTNDSLHPFKQKINLFGYSFGANPLARAITDIPVENVERIFFIAPLALINNKDLSNVSQESLSGFHSFNLKFVEFLVRGYGEVLRLSSKNEWDNYFSGNHEDSLVNIPKELVDKIQIHYGEKDKLVSRQLLDPLIDIVDDRSVTVYKEIGHSKDLIIKALLSNQ